MSHPSDHFPDENVSPGTSPPPPPPAPGAYNNLPPQGGEPYPGPYPSGFYQPPFRPAQVPGRGLAVGGMVMGILALCFLCFSLLSMACGIVAVILCGLAKSKGCRTAAATAGLVCGLIAFGISAILYVLQWTPGLIGI